MLFSAEIGPITITTDPKKFQDELRELYVQVSSCASHWVCWHIWSQVYLNPYSVQKCAQSLNSQRTVTLLNCSKVIYFLWKKSLWTHGIVYLAYCNIYGRYDDLNELLCDLKAMRLGYPDDLDFTIQQCIFRLSKLTLILINIY